ncbi:molybdate ABC transporter substrate-binding protein [Leucobacter sp. wl10]|nr:molybdate ABC transporter substrate-binding protein [Leucobacter sp. wl10]
MAGAGVAVGLATALLGCASGAGGRPGGAAGSEEALSGELTVFAAASLQAAFDELAAEFASENPGVAFAPSVYDGSSVLVTQLEGGARADVFASADEANMEKADEADLLAGPAQTFATNELVIAVAPGNPLGIESLADLAAPTASGEPPITVMCAAEVPCGGAARTLLDLNGVALAPASEEQNVSATLAKVVAGEADAGLVYRTDVRGADGEVDGVDIEGAAENPNAYPIAVLRESASPEAARAFVEFVRSERGRELLAGYGFGAP